jgi:hypothetical protein
VVEWHRAWLKVPAFHVEEFQAEVERCRREWQEMEKMALDREVIQEDTAEWDKLNFLSREQN